MWIAETIDETRQRRNAPAGAVALVPTMGALHEGHLSLIRAAKRHADDVIVSIFVNPSQFAPHEDFDRYPRPMEVDLEACRREGVAGVFAPSAAEMYPPGAPASDVFVPSMGSILEGEHRPHFFHGVCRVVLKLLNIIEPDVAMFGQKDFQQWRIIEAMVADLNLPVQIVGEPTVREADGLALSSRNVYLEAEAREHALGLARALDRAEAMIEREGDDDTRAVERAMAEVLQSNRVAADYAVVRHPVTLAAIDAIDLAATNGVVALVAGRVGAVRLIDNRWIGRTIAEK